MPYNTKPILLDANGKPIPQLFNQTADAYEPLQGSAAGGMLVSLTGSNVPDSQPLPVKQMGRNLELIQTSFNAVAVTTTALNLGPLLSKSTLSKYEELYLRVISTLDNASHSANPEIRLYDSGGGFVPVQGKILTDYFGSTQFLTKADLSALGVGGLFNLQVAFLCATAPTSGQITIELHGNPY